MKKIDVAIVGATGLVGTTLLKILQERAFPLNHVYLLASHQSAGKVVEVGGRKLPVQSLEDFDFTKSQLSFFCVGNDLAQRYVPIAAAAGNVVIDKSYFFRLDVDVPLIVPEVNIQALEHFRLRGIIANPNCTTIPISVALKPIYDAVGIERVNVSTYQSVSGSGKEAISELETQSRAFLANEKIESKIYQQQIAFNVLPHCDDFQENGYTREEMKIVWEMRKILGDETLAINPTAVRVPVMFGHAASLHIETKEKINMTQAMDLLAKAPGVKLVTGEFPYSTPAMDAAGKDHVFIGRVREDISHKKGLNLWVVADNLRKGAALNAVQIAEQLVEHHNL